MSVLRLATRDSALAGAQSRQVADRLSSVAGCTVVLVPIRSVGDVDRGPLAQIGGSGVFVSSLRQALLDGEADIAVHSLKDLPTAGAEGITLAAVPPREDPRDVVVARDGLTLGGLPHGSVVGTGSPRRAAQLRALGLGLDIAPIRGNVETRIRLVTDCRIDAVVLAKAGLTRLGRSGEVTEVLDPLQMLPAPGQGALAVECRTGEPELLAMLASALDDPPSRTVVAAERSLLAALEAGCSAPVGALADIALGDDGDELWLRAVAVAPDGARMVRMSSTGPPGDAVSVGEALAADMLAEGASTLIQERAS
jgi:hydroxymethylbilane synthase